MLSAILEPGGVGSGGSKISNRDSVFKILCSADILLFKTLVNGFVLLKWHMSE